MKRLHFFLCDSLDIHFNESEWVRVYSGAVDASRNNDMLEAFWYSSDEGSMKYFEINNSLKERFLQ